MVTVNKILPVLFISISTSSYTSSQASLNPSCSFFLRVQQYSIIFMYHNLFSYHRLHQEAQKALAVSVPSHQLCNNKDMVCSQTVFAKNLPLPSAWVLWEAPLTLFSMIFHRLTDLELGETELLVILPNFICLDKQLLNALASQANQSLLWMLCRP